MAKRRGRPVGRWVVGDMGGEFRRGAFGPGGSVVPAAGGALLRGLAARVWSEVTEGKGVVLDEQGMEVPPDEVTPAGGGEHD